jgi:starvation-inducible DNA-binding protein
MYNTRNDLSITVREKVIPRLQARLADSVDLFTQVKQAHWNVKGPSFIALQELFDEIAEVVEEHSDLLAERITALGGRADGTARLAAAQSNLEEYPLDIAAGMQHVAAVADKLAIFGRSIRAGIDLAAKLGDADTADLFTEISRAIDKQLWFVEAHYRQNTEVRAAKVRIAAAPPATPSEPNASRDGLNQRFPSACRSAAALCSRALASSSSSAGMKTPATPSHRNREGSDSVTP